MRIYAYIAAATMALPSVLAHITQATACGNNSVIQLGSRGQPCFYPDPSSTASLSPACSGSLAKAFNTHLSGNITLRSIELYRINTGDVIDSEDVFSEPVAACVTGALGRQFLTHCWAVGPGEDVCANANSACGSRHLQGDAVYRDECAVGEPCDPSEWVAVLPWQIIGWIM